MLFLVRRGRLDASRADAVRAGGLYWHFVDVVWIIVVAVVYLGVVPGVASGVTPAVVPAVAVGGTP
jgi:hypothetical protein